MMSVIAVTAAVIGVLLVCTLAIAYSVRPKPFKYRKKPVTAHRLHRNAPCHCGSGRKYKHCHLAKDEAAESEAKALEERRAENVIGGEATLFRHAVGRVRAFDKKRRAEDF